MPVISSQFQQIRDKNLLSTYGFWKLLPLQGFSFALLVEPNRHASCACFFATFFSIRVCIPNLPDARPLKLLEKTTLFPD
jgi:hypothetical protein